MRIGNWAIADLGDDREVSVLVDDFRLWFRLPRSYQVSTAGDPFLAAALLPAMLKGEPLEIDPDLPVSPALLENLRQVQEIHHAWNPVLKIIPIQARTTPSTPVNAGGMSFFSGGVDSLFTFLKRQDEISHAVFIHGFDFVVDSDVYKAAVTRNAAFVSSFGKTLIPVETNTYTFSYHHNMSRKLTQGSALAGIAHLLGFPRVYLPSSDAYGYLSPLGSHPLTDPLYSNESTKIIHDGAEARRIDKVLKIAQSAPALSVLRVCFEDMNTNCGKCRKCVRTMIPLELLGVHNAPFPARLKVRTIKRVDWGSEPNMFKQNLELAAQMKNKRRLRVLKACQRNFERKKLAREFDRVLFGGTFMKMYRRVVKVPPWHQRVYPTPPEE